VPFSNHLNTFEDLITPYEETRAGFIALALEKNRKATPFVEEAKVLRTLAQAASNPRELLPLHDIRDSVLTASGISDKARNHLTEADKTNAIMGLIENFLEPAGLDFVDELVYRFLLTRGDSLGGQMRNLGGAIGEWRLIRTLVSTLSVQGRDYQYLDKNTRRWRQPNNSPDFEQSVKGLSWTVNNQDRTLILNLTVPLVRKNVDFCLFNCAPNRIIVSNRQSAHYQADSYLVLGELKGGIDPAGADEHWKTANTALSRIRSGFNERNARPDTFFVGAAVERAMAQEIYQQLEDEVLTNAANLTNENQVISLCHWLINL